ncbi:MAG: TlpA family protein disulfide reductase [Prevotella sp.]|nr:TlpA family protein disulfide reductase [Prevotella sp.]
MMLAAVAICGWAANDDNKLKVNLDIVDFGDTVVVVHSDKEETFTGKDGKFEFVLDVDKVFEAYFVQPKLMRGDTEDPRIFKIPIVGGEEVRLWQTNRERYDVDGTQFYADYHQVDLFNEEAAKGVLENTKKYREMRSADAVNEEACQKFLDEVFNPEVDRYHQKLLAYVKAHPKQEAAMMLVHSLEDLDLMKQGYDLLDTSVREGRLKPLYDKWVREAEQALEAEAKEKAAAKKQEAGVEAPLFTLNDLEGKPLALSSMRGKYVVLDFWGSWCVWCIKGFPKMKEYYAKYPGKFEILGVDCNDTQEKWKAAVQKHELPWKHVYCPDDATVLADYGVTGFPTKIIVGPDGKIVKAIVGEDPSFYTLLDELFGK